MNRKKKLLIQFKGKNLINFSAVGKRQTLGVSADTTRLAQPAATFACPPQHGKSDIQCHHLRFPVTRQKIGNTLPGTRSQVENSVGLNFHQIQTLQKTLPDFLLQRGGLIA